MKAMRWWRLAVVALMVVQACSSTGGGADNVVTDVPGDSVQDVPKDTFVDVSEDILPADLLQSDVDVPAPDAVGDDVSGADVPVTIDDGPATKPLPGNLSATLQNVLDEYLAFSGDPGISIAVRMGDGASWAGVSGVADSATNAPMTTDTGFRVGSNTKPYMAALIMLLVEEGKVDLDVPLTTYLPEYPNWSAVTTRMLLGMQSGLPDYMWVAEFMIASVFDPASLTGPDVLLSYVKDKPLTFVPGVGCEYSNTNYVVVGMIAQSAGGMAPEVQLKERFFDRLGLKNTYLDVTGVDNPGLAHGYVDVGIVGQQFGLGADTIGMIPAEWFLHDLYMDATYTFPPMFSWTAGALVTTPLEASSFLREMMRGRLISPASVLTMQTTHSCLLLGSQVEYGLGLSTGDTPPYGREWGHGGMNFGYEANTIYFPDKDITLSHMHNTLPEQSWPFQAMMIKQMDVLPEAPVYPACLLPDGFFDATGDHVAIRFRGAIDGGDSIVNLVGVIGGNNTPLYGFGTSAKLVDAAGTPRVEVTSNAPSVTTGVDRRQVVLGLDAVVLAGKDGPIQPGPGALTLAVVELQIDPKGVAPTTGCVVAVPDAARTPKVHLCGGESFQAASGEMLKLFADVPVTNDSAAIDAYVAQSGKARCF